jgi:hypothetical protein
MFQQNSVIKIILRYFLSFSCASDRHKRLHMNDFAEGLSSWISKPSQIKGDVTEYQFFIKVFRNQKLEMLQILYIRDHLFELFQVIYNYFQLDSAFSESMVAILIIYFFLFQKIIDISIDT